MKQLRQEDKIIESVKHIHMIGIGGSGMCPLAEILNSKGYILSGSDNNESDPLERVKALGVTVHMGHRAENIKGAQLVVYLYDNTNFNFKQDGSYRGYRRKTAPYKFQRCYGKLSNACMRILRVCRYFFADVAGYRRAA